MSEARTAVSSASGAGEVERDMAVHQRGLVDTCFEEGQYEAGIAVLDQLRSPRYRPFGPHVRQLIYIALHLPPPAADTNDTGKSRLEASSPSKFFSKQHSSSLSPSPAATEAALNVLTAFAETNTPGALFRALPRYPASAGDANATNAILEAGVEDDDSYISRQSIRIRNARDCWSILKDGFVQRGNDSPPTPKRKRRTRRQAVDEDETVDLHGEPPQPVGQYAWPVLDWILTLLEKDEKIVERSGQPLFSPLLLSQIPPPRTDNGGRWDFEVPLDIVFYCLQEADFRRRMMGVRLLTLLINLASTTFVDFPMFLKAVSSRVFSLPLDDLTSLFAAFPPSRAVKQFKLELCKNYLTDFGSTSAPQVRAQPRRIPARRRQTEPSPSKTSASAASALEAGAASIARKHPAILPTDILGLIKGPPSVSDEPGSAKTLRVKVELALAYWMLQRQTPPEARNVEWPEVLRAGRLKEAFDVAFALARQGGGPLAEDEHVQGLKPLLAVISVW